MTAIRRCAAAICALGLGTASAASLARADDIEMPSGVPDTITGMAWSDATQEVLVTDEGGRIAAVDTAGKNSRDVAFTGTAESVQALSLFDGMLYVGDIGDESTDREFVTVFRINPDSGATNYWAWDFTYPEGPRDAKAMAVSGKGRIYIVTGGDDPGIYRAGLEPSRSGTNAMVRAADAPAGVTDAVFMDDGSTLMLRTGNGVDLLDAYSWEVQSSTTYVDAPAGESITNFTDGRMLVGGGTQLRDEPLPDGTATVTPSSTAGSSPTPGAPDDASPDPTAPGADEDPQTSQVSRRGTMFALMGAAAVAVIAGLVVFVARD